MKKLRFLSVIIFVLFYSTIAAQIRLPDIPKGEYRNCKINGTYNPHSSFSDLFPDFLKNGKYQFEYTQQVFGFDNEGFEGFNSFSSLEYPCTFVATKNTLKGLGKIIVQFIANNESNSKLYLDRENSVNSALSLKYPAYNNLNSYANTAYTDFNSNYKESVISYFIKKEIDSLIIIDAGSLGIPMSTSTKDLILQFSYIQSNTWKSSKTKKNFPSHSLFELKIKSGDGTELKSYKQAIFFDGEQKKGMHEYKPELVKHFVTKHTFPIAVKCLTNRFLNDYSYFKIIIDRNLEHENKFTPRVKAYKSRLNSINADKEDIRFNLESVGETFEDIGVVNSSIATSLNETSQLNNNGAGGIASMIVGGIYQHKAKKEQRNLNKMLMIYKQKLDEINETEQGLIREIEMAKLENEEISFLSFKSNKEDLYKLYDQNKQKSTQVKNHINEEFNNLNSSTLNQVNNSFETAINANKNVESSAEATANNNNNSNDCSKKSDIEWKQTSEYQKCNSQSVINTSQASCERAKAKLIEITLKNCRSQLPENEIQMLEKTMTELSDRATQMDKDAFRRN